ncbi:hypothetical protein [Microbacterium sp. OR16]|uniref:hypothetical protein n=1 Tax=Microbacterium sp. OR16 TaxID=3095345 RepID=UPI0039B4CE22
MVSPPTIDACSTGTGSPARSWTGTVTKTFVFTVVGVPTPRSHSLNRSARI